MHLYTFAPPPGPALDALLAPAADVAPSQETGSASPALGGAPSGLP
jgi:hypothetical protein